MASVKSKAKPSSSHRPSKEGSTPGSLIWTAWGWVEVVMTGLGASMSFLSLFARRSLVRFTSSAFVEARNTGMGLRRWYDLLGGPPFYWQKPSSEIIGTWEDEVETRCYI